MIEQEIILKMKSILHVVNISFVIPYFLGNQLGYFRDRGYFIHVICSPSDELEGYAKEQKFVYKEVPILRKIDPVQDLKSVWAIFRYIKQNKIDIVSGHTPKGSLLAMIAAFLARVSVRIYFRHGLVYETSKGLKRFLLISMDRLASLLATKIVCVSPSVYHRSLEDRLNPEKKQVVLANGTCNGIDLKRFDKANIDSVILSDLRNKWRLNESQYVIGFTGRLVKDKGIIELVQAFKFVSESHSNIVLLLVGMLEERDALPMEIIQEIKENPAIIHTGYVDNRMIEYYYCLMNVFVLPSYREGFPTSVLEASAMEVPVITTKATGCIDAIVPELTGLFVKHDAYELANVMTHLIDTPETCRSLGRNGRAFVTTHFEEHIVWKEIEKMYQ